MRFLLVPSFVAATSMVMIMVMLMAMICRCSHAWILPSVVSTPNMIRVQQCHSSKMRPVLLSLGADDKQEPDDGEEDGEDSLLERINKIEQSGDNLFLDTATAAAASYSAAPYATPKLGIDIGSQLEPFTEAEAAELKAAAMEVINDGVAEGIDEIERLRKQMKQQIDKQKRQMELKSDLQLQREEAKLMTKIDTMTSTFLDKTRLSREETKLIAKADQSQQGRGVELGVWGNIGGAAVVTTSSNNKNIGLLGSVDNAKLQVQRQAKKQRDQDMTDLKRPTSSSSTTKDDEDLEVGSQNSNRVIVIADISQVSPSKQNTKPHDTTRYHHRVHHLQRLTHSTPLHVLDIDIINYCGTI
jgi:hypothetical protein